MSQQITGCKLQAFVASDDFQAREWIISIYLFVYKDFLPLRSRIIRSFHWKIAKGWRWFSQNVRSWIRPSICLDVLVRMMKPATFQWFLGSFSAKKIAGKGIQDWVVVSKIFCFLSYLGRWSNLTSIFFKRMVQPSPTRKNWGRKSKHIGSKGFLDFHVRMLVDERIERSGHFDHGWSTPHVPPSEMRV